MLQKPEKNCLQYDTISFMLDKVKKSQKKQKIAEALFIDGKTAFDYTSEVKLTKKIEKLVVDNDFIGEILTYFTEK